MCSYLKVFVKIALNSHLGKALTGLCRSNPIVLGLDRDKH